MIIPDVNLLLYATSTGFREHPRAREWWEELLNGDREVGLTQPVIYGFLRLATHRLVLAIPMTPSQALAEIERWLRRRQVRPLVAGPRHLELSFSLVRELGTAANLTTDIQIAAHAIENQAEVHSHDADFARFPGLKWVDPIAGKERRVSQKWRS